jgi:hypothetical protein
VVVRFVPGNSGVSGRGVDYCALAALASVPFYDRHRDGAARDVVDVAGGALPTSVLLRPRASLSGSDLLLGNITDQG